ncbi:hypothetical protein E4U21_006876 [Claviceps maximensis]|nr:hypothetical protein E4U21_006876 [Claviceps maximensis]
MASLRNIMNVDVDDDHAGSHSAKDTSPKQSRQSDTSSVISGARGRGLVYSRDTSLSRNHGVNPSTRSLHSPPTDQNTSAMAQNHLPPRISSGRRQSNTSTDSVGSRRAHGKRRDRGHGRSHTGSSPNASLRPCVPQQETPIKLTPITGRVSRAKKGVPVHTCDMCRPPKTFTRAEHLRRHQLSHQPAGLRCPAPGCGKVFHRRDLLDRHQLRHEQEDRVGKPSRGAKAKSPYNARGRRRPSYTSSSPPASMIPLQQSYGRASPTATTSSMPMSSGYWATHKSTPMHLHQADTDVTMDGVKDEYLLDAVSNGQTTTASMAPEFSQPRSMPAIPAIDFVQNICASAAAATNLAWPVTTTLATGTNEAAFSLPNVLVTDSSQPALSLSHAGWAPMQQATPRNIPESMIATSGGFSVPYTYGSPLPPSYTSIYNDEHTIGYSGYDASPILYGVQLPTPEVRSPSPRFILGRSSETMVTVPAPLPADRVFHNLMYRGNATSWPGMLSQGILPVSLSQEAQSAVPTYIDVYWDKVHPLYPIIHRATVEDDTDNEPEQVHVLRCAMAAVATQFLGHRDHRINGGQLHAYAWQKSKAFTQSAQWSIPAMQCILLCEYYARFRGRHKKDYQPSSRFLFMYQMVCQASYDDHVSTHQSASISKLSGTNHQRWTAWIYLESCRRLLSACFLLSVHGMCYYEQPYSTFLDVENTTTSRFRIPLTGSTASLWEATNAEAWAEIDMSSVKMTTVGDVMQDECACNIESPAFDVSLVIAAHALLLPTRQERQEVELLHDISGFRSKDLLMFRYFSNRPGATTYLALHYTPLHALLAVSGESWVFNMKILDIRIFAEHKRKLSQWQKSGTCAIATVFAARAIRNFLNLSNDAGQAAPTAAPKGVLTRKDISDYWGLYVCTLICWAFGHPSKLPCHGKRLLAQSRAINWIQAVADMEPSQLQVSTGREDSQAIVGLVRDILEKDCLGGRNMLFADSVGVLRKLEEYDNWDWF